MALTYKYNDNDAKGHGGGGGTALDCDKPRVKQRDYFAFTHTHTWTHWTQCDAIIIYCIYIYIGETWCVLRVEKLCVNIFEKQQPYLHVCECVC